MTEYADLSADEIKNLENDAVQEESEEVSEGPVNTCQHMYTRGKNKGLKCCEAYPDLPCKDKKHVKARPTHEEELREQLKSLNPSGKYDNMTCDQMEKELADIVAQGMSESTGIPVEYDGAEILRQAHVVGLSFAEKGVDIYCKNKGGRYELISIEGASQVLDEASHNLRPCYEAIYMQNKEVVDKYLGPFTILGFTTVSICSNQINENLKKNLQRNAEIV